MAICLINMTSGISLQSEPEIVVNYLYIYLKSYVYAYDLILQLKFKVECYT